MEIDYREERGLNGVRLSNHLMLFWAVLLLMACIIAVNGIITEVSLGDESHHYGFAQNIYWAGKRVAFDPIYESGNTPGFFYNDPALWHLILAFLWKILGGISQTVAQVYHVFFFILLVWLTFILAKETMGKEERWVPAFIVATVPMVVSFGTLFYMDVPMTVFITLSFYFILRKRYIEAGFASGLAYFTKFNSVFFFPGFLFLIIWNDRKRFWNLVGNIAFFILPIVIVYLPDLYWRKTNITSQMNTIAWSNVSRRLSIVMAGKKWGEYLNSHLTNPVDLAKYFGLALPFLIFFYLLRFRRWDKKAAVLWVPVVSYLICFIIIFGIEADIRYLLPILPFLAVFFALSFSSLGNRLRFIIIAVCIIQFASTTYYVHQKRLILPEVKEGFEYVKKNVPEKTLILYPEENLLLYGHRRIIWIAVKGYRPNDVGLNLLFWGADDKRMNGLLKANHIDYILIKKSRIYDDSKEQHLGGYPQSFVEKLSQLDGWLKVFENPGVALWKKVSS
jgi:hypothetical protein